MSPPAKPGAYLCELERLKEDSNYWSSFSELKKILGEPVYVDTITAKLTPRVGTLIPENYELLWKLGIKGFVNYNLDSFAIDAYSKINRAGVEYATGKEPQKFSQYLFGNSNFVFHPHGVLADSLSWVFDASERTALLSNDPYKKFLASLLSTKHAIILGFGPDDFSFKFLLQDILITANQKSLQHYYFSPNPEESSITELREFGVRTIPYHPADTFSHPEIKECLEDILAYIPTDDEYGSAYSGATRDPSTLPPEEDLLLKPIEETRELLNEAISSIIPADRSPTKSDIKALEEFYKQNLRVIHQAWLVVPNTRFDLLHGYKILSELGRGAFGQVYEGIDETTKKRVAIKILLPEVREKSEYLSSFRRGVHSMKILAEKELNGIARIYKAYEVPASIVMDMIDGATLTMAVENNYIQQISRALTILSKIGYVVNAAHNVPERVLHRDLKPDNIILKGCYSGLDDVDDVVVLDFDLSWHKGALDLSVVHGARAQGYAAPEQTALKPDKTANTRSKSVDVFGFGMVCYFVLTGDNPRPNEHKFKEYRKNIENKIRSNYNSRWNALPGFLASLIEGCTKDKQDDRMSFTDALVAIDLARNAEESEVISPSSPFLLEQMVFNIEPGASITWKDRRCALMVQFIERSKELEMELLGADEGSLYISVSLSKTRAEFDNRSSTKYMENAKNKAASHFHSSPFFNTNPSIGYGRVHIKTNIRLPRSVSLSFVRHVARKITSAKSDLSFN